MTPEFVLYTYQQVVDPSKGTITECHAYGPTSKDNAQLTGENLAQGQQETGSSQLFFMVLPLEAMPV